jgi:tetratricopeptide (TPR) repeat protein
MGPVTRRPTDALFLFTALHFLACFETESTTQHTKKPSDQATRAEAEEAKQTKGAAKSAPSGGEVPAPLPPLPPLPKVTELTFEVRNQSLWVEAPHLGTSLAERAQEIKETKIVGNDVTIHYTDPLSCKESETLHKGLDYFLARLENTRAFRVYKEGKFREAARGFERALGLDPTYGKARSNHIAALARAGDIAAANLAFQVALTKDPVSAYMKLLEDEDFSPLRGEFRAKGNGSPALQLIGDDLNNYASYSKRSGLLSVLRKEVSWGAENWTAELHVFDARTEQRVSEHTLVRWHDTDEEGHVRPALKKEVEARLLRMNEAMRALEFVSLPESRRGQFHQPGTPADRVEAPLSSLGKNVVVAGDILELREGEKVLETFHSTLHGARPSQIYAVPELNALVYFGAYEVAEGCDSGPETRLEVFKTTQLNGAPK